MALSTFVLLCNRHHCSAPELSIFPNWDCVPPWNMNSPFPPQPWRPPSYFPSLWFWLLSFLMWVELCSIRLFVAGGFTQQHILRWHPRSVPFQGQVLSHPMEQSPFVSPFIRQWTLGCFHSPHGFTQAWQQELSFLRVSELTLREGSCNYGQMALAVRGVCLLWARHPEGWGPSGSW